METTVSDFISDSAYCICYEDYTLFSCDIRFLILLELKDLPQGRDLPDLLRSRNIIDTLGIYRNDENSHSLQTPTHVTSEYVLHNGQKIVKIAPISNTFNSIFNCSKNSEELLEVLSASIGDVFFVLDYKTMDYCFLSENIKQLLGFTAQEIKQMGFISLVKKVDSVKTVQADNISTGEPIKAKLSIKDYLIRTASGEAKWIREAGETIKDKSGKSVGFFGRYTDIDSEKKALEKLRETRSNLNIIVQNVPIGLAIVQNDSVVFANSELASILSASGPDDIVNTPFIRFCPENKRQMFLSMYEAVIERKEKFENFTDDFYDVNGNLTKIQVSSLPTVFNGKPAVQIIARSLSKKEKIRKIKSTLSSILEESYIVDELAEFYRYIHYSVKELLDADGFFIAIINKYSRELEFMYTYDTAGTDSEFRKVEKVLAAMVIDRKHALILNGRQIEERLKKYMREEISDLPACWMGVPLKLSDEIIGLMAVQNYRIPEVYREFEKELMESIAFTISRVIERKIREEERQGLITQLEKSNTSKDKLFSVLSHDLRSPFSSLQGYIQILREDLHEMGEDDIRTILSSISEISESIRSQLDSLLEYSRFQLGKIKTFPEKLSLNSATKSVVKLFENQISQKKLEISVQIPDDHLVFIDPNILRSVLQNLLSNSIKFSHKGGKIDLSSKVLSGSQLQFTLMDFGVGFNEEDLKEFKETGKIKSRKGTFEESGTGFGLQIVQDFIQSLNQSISIQNHHLGGTLIEFTLPNG